MKKKLLILILILILISLPVLSHHTSIKITGFTAAMPEIESDDEECPSFKFDMIKNQCELEGNVFYSEFIGICKYPFCSPTLGACQSPSSLETQKISCENSGGVVFFVYENNDCSYIDCRIENNTLPIENTSTENVVEEMIVEGSIITEQPETIEEIKSYNIPLITVIALILVVCLIYIVYRRKN